MRYINAIVKILTFSGGFLRGFWEQMLCKAYGVPVENKKYFQFNEMAGHVEHEPLPTAGKSFWFCTISGLAMLLFGTACAVPGVIYLFYFDVASVYLKILSWLFIYTAFCAFTNLFPSFEDALMMWEKYKTFGKAKRIIYAPGAAIMYIGSYAESWGITFATNLVLTVLLFLFA